MSVVELGQTSSGGWDATFFATLAGYEGASGGGSYLDEPKLAMSDEVASVLVSLLVTDPGGSSDTGVRIELGLGGLTSSFTLAASSIVSQMYMSYGLTDVMIRDLTITGKARYPRRLAGSITTANRKDYLGTIWGPRPRVSPPGDDTDVRGYISADVGWYYYGGPTDGSDNYVEATVSFTWETRPPGGLGGPPHQTGSYSKTLHLNGPSSHAGLGFIQSPNAEARGITWDYGAVGEDGEGRLTVSSYNGTPAAAYSEGTIVNASAETVGSCYVNGNEVGMTCLYGAGFSSGASLGGLQWNAIEGVRVHSFQGECINAAGASHAAALFDVIPYDGPAQSAIDPWDVNHYCPFDDGSLSSGTDVGFSVPGGINPVSERYSGGVTARVDGVTSTFFTFSKNTVGATPEAWGWVFQPSSLEAAEFLGDAFRFPILLPGTAPIWTAATVHFQSPYTLHGFGSGVEGWTASAGSVSASGGALVMSGAANPKIASVDWGNKLQNNYRYLRVRIKADDAGTAVRAKVGSKTWEYTAGTTYADWDIDLCAPTNLSADNQDLSRAERLWSGGAVGASQGGWPWGLEVEKDMDAGTYGSVTFTIEADTANQVYIDSITGLEKGSESGWCVVGEQVQEDSRFRVKDDTATEVYAKRQLLLVRNGHIVEELWCGTTWTDPASGTGQKEAHGAETIASMFSAYAFSDDASAVTRLQPAAAGSGPFDNSAPAYMLKPAYYALTDGRGITAHYAADRVRLWDGATNLTLKAVRMIGGGIAGLLCDADGAILSEVVDVKLSGSLRDHDMTDGQGEYFTPAAAVAGLTVLENPWDVVQRSVPANTDTVGSILDCIIMRDSLAASVAVSVAAGKDSAQSVTGTVYRIFGRDGSLWLDRYTMSLKSWTDPVELFAGSHPALTVTDAERARTIRLTYSDGLGAMKERTSTDDGATWSAEVDLSIDGTHKDRLIDTDSANEYLFYYDAGAIYMRRRSLYSGSAWSAISPVTVVASAGDDAITAQLFPAYDSLSGTRKRRLQLSYTTTGGSIADVVSSDDGETWS